MTCAKHNPQQRISWQWWLLLFMLLGVALVGSLGLVANSPSPAIAIAFGALAFAFALHYFSVTIPIHSARFNISCEDSKACLKSLASRAASHAMFVMGAGLAVVAFAGAAAVLKDYSCAFCAAVTLYGVAVIAMVWCIGHYAFALRMWPETVDSIVAEDKARKRSVSADPPNKPIESDAERRRGSSA